MFPHSYRSLTANMKMGSSFTGLSLTISPARKVHVDMTTRKHVAPMNAAVEISILNCENF